MSWMRAKSSVKPDYTGLQLQTSTSTLPIALVYGQTKIAGNVIWYANFQTHGEKSGGGKGAMFSSPATSYYYTADLIIALCEGPISAIGEIWRDQSTYTLAGLGLTLFDGTVPQSAWGYLASAYPKQALAYQGTAYVCAASYNLGSSASVGNHNFEAIALLAGTGANGIDADPAQVIQDFLTNAQHGVGFPSASIATATLIGSSGDASLQSYCAAMGICFSPALDSQEQASSILARWLQIVNCAAVWSGGTLKFIPYGDAAISAGAHVARTVQAAVPVPVTPATGSAPPPALIVCPAAQFVADGGVKYAFSGAALTYIGASAPSVAGTYGISPNGTYLFAPGDEDQVVAIAFTAAIPTGYTPNLTPLYSLTDLDFVDDKGGKGPAWAERVDRFTLPNVLRVETLSRDNQYAATPVEARDQADIDLSLSIGRGPRIGSTIQAHEICDDLLVGPIVAQTILQRQLYIRAHYHFTLSWEYALLEPMDIVEITDANLGLSAAPVRIVAIEENDQGLLAVTAEEMPSAISTPALYPSAGVGKSIPNQAVYAQPVNAPLIFEAPTALTNGVAQLWFGASGGSSGVADPNWGGCYIWMSFDGVTFGGAPIGTIAN
ncbi:MAG TPA: phage tail protein, partial [Roseiarcus sp.]|nr:phage tail protein [Roseiarcus sp.]